MTPIITFLLLANRPLSTSMKMHPQLQSGMTRSFRCWKGKTSLKYIPRPPSFLLGLWGSMKFYHDDVIKWKHFPRYWPFVRGIQRSPVNSPHKGQWRGALMFTLICARINGRVNNREAGDLRRHRAHYGVSVMAHLNLKQNVPLELIIAMIICNSSKFPGHILVT